MQLNYLFSPYYENQTIILLKIKVLLTESDEVKSKFIMQLFTHSLRDVDYGMSGQI